ncbi:hypothetical protein Tco_0176293, partial [Tanacetum coccineum]
PRNFIHLKDRIFIFPTIRVGIRVVEDDTVDKIGENNSKKDEEGIKDGEKVIMMVVLYLMKMLMWRLRN